MKIRSVGAELLHANGEKTDITKLKAAFRKFAKFAKNTYISYA
jgi:hypothetical protein